MFIQSVLFQRSQYFVFFSRFLQFQLVTHFKVSLYFQINLFVFSDQIAFECDLPLSAST